MEWLKVALVCSSLIILLIWGLLSFIEDIGWNEYPEYEPEEDRVVEYVDVYGRSKTSHVYDVNWDRVVKWRYAE